MNRVGFWSALSVVCAGAIYFIFLAAGMATAGLNAPIVDPLLFVMELLTFLSAPLLVVTMAALHCWTTTNCKIYSLIAVIFMTLMAGVTMSVHFVELTALRQMGSGGLSWPSVPYALELLAWDIFLGLSMLFSAPVFAKTGLESWVRAGMLSVGVLCIAGSSGPMFGDMRFQLIAVVAYAVGLPIVFSLLAIHFWRALRSS